MLQTYMQSYKACRDVSSPQGHIEAFKFLKDICPGLILMRR